MFLSKRFFWILRFLCKRNHICEFSNSSLNYDCITLEFDTQSGNGVNNAVKYDPFIVELYFDKDAAASGNLDETFNITLGTDSTQAF